MTAEHIFRKAIKAPAAVFIIEQPDKNNGTLPDKSLRKHCRCRYWKWFDIQLCIKIADFSSNYKEKRDSGGIVRLDTVGGVIEGCIVKAGLVGPFRFFREHNYMILKSLRRIEFGKCRRKFHQVSNDNITSENEIKITQIIMQD